MSHFSVAVVTKEYPTQPVLEALMAPFHEFECTGRDDQYVQTLDITEAKRAEYAQDTTTRMRDAAGALHDAWSDKCHREFTPEELAKIGRGPHGTGVGHGMTWTSKDWGDGKGYRAKVHFAPEGMEQINVPVKDVYTFTEWLEDYNGMKRVVFGVVPDTTHQDYKYGYFTTDERGEVASVVHRTNPNHKWDYWQIGGRYSDRLLVTLGGAPMKCNIGKKSQILWERMQTEKYSEHCQRLGDALLKISAASGLTVAELLDKHKAAAEQYIAMRTEYDASGQPEAFHSFYAARKAGAIQEAETIGLWDGKNRITSSYDGPGIEMGSPDPYAQITAQSHFTTFAVLKDGVWAERGEMLFFGCVKDEKKPTEWHVELGKIIESVPDDHYITVVDCHC